MSNYLAVATTTETIAQVIRDAVTPVVPGAEVTTDRPDRGAGEAAARVNVYLYQVVPNAALRNADLPLRRADGTLESRPRTALNLSYLINFYGRDEQLVAQQLLGLTAAALHLHARLTRADIARAVQAAPGGFLNDSNLAEQAEPLNLSPDALSLEELSKLWSVMFQVPYTLSMAYQCAVVMIDGPPAAEALPVRRVALSPRPSLAPEVRSVAAAAPGSPLVAGGEMVIRGSGLGGDGTTVEIGGVVLTPAAGDASDTQVTVALTDTRLEAGPASLVVVAGGVRSAPAPFVLSPNVAAVSFRAAKGGGGAAALRLTLDPPVWSTTPVTVLLNPAGGAPGPLPPAYAFDAPPPAPPGPPARVSTLTVPIPGVAAGTYLVRVRVNGAESPLATRVVGGAAVYASPRVRVR